MKAANKTLQTDSNGTNKELAELKSILERAAQISNEVTHVVEHNLNAIGAMETELPPVEKRKNRYQVKLGTPVPPGPSSGNANISPNTNLHTPDSIKHGVWSIPSTPSAVTDSVMAAIISVWIEVGSGITMHHSDGTMYSSNAKR